MHACFALPRGSNMYFILLSGFIFTMTVSFFDSSHILEGCSFSEESMLARKNLAAPSSKNVFPMKESLMAHTTWQCLISYLLSKCVDYAWVIMLHNLH